LPVGVENLGGEVFSRLEKDPTSIVCLTKRLSCDRFYTDCRASTGRRLEIATIIQREDEGSHQQNIGIGGVDLSFASREGPSFKGGEPWLRRFFY